VRPKINLSQVLIGCPVKSANKTEGKVPVNGRGNQWRLILGLGAAVLLIILASFAGLAFGSGGPSDPGGASSVPKVVAELEEKRTSTSRTFRLSNGELETRIYETPINYKDSDGDWHPIEQELHQSSNGSVSNGDNSFDVQLPEDLDRAPAKLSIGGDWISQMPTGIALAPAEVDQGVASYEAAGSAAELQYSGLPNGLKENIVLADPSAPETYHFRLDASPGVTPTLAGDGSIRFMTGEGDPVAAIPAPVMFDGADVPSPADAASYSLEPRDDGGSWTLTVSVDPAWLSAPDRAWPVTLDPSITVSSPDMDCVLVSVDTLNRCGNSGFSYLVAKANYVSSGADEYAHSVLHFAVGSIPRNAEINSATIGLNSSKEAKNWVGVGVYRVSQLWNTGVNWISAGNSLGNWSKAGGSTNYFLEGISPGTRGGSAPGPWLFSGYDVRETVYGWVHGTIPNYGVLLMLNNETVHTCCIERRIEWESSTAPIGQKPYLSVQYELPATNDSQITSPTDGTKSAKRFILTSAWDHSNVEGVKFQYRLNRNPPPKTLGEVQKPTDPWADIPASQVLDGNNQTVNWPVGVNVDDRSSPPLYWNARSVVASTSPSARIQIRAVLSGSPGAGGYTKAVEVELDKVNGGVTDTFAPIGPGSVDLLTGSFTVSRGDFSVSGFNSALSFSRSFSSGEAASHPTGVLGPGWEPSAPFEMSNAYGWQRLKLESIVEDLGEGLTETYNSASLKPGTGGAELNFAEDEKGSFITPPEAAGAVLYRDPNTGNIFFTDPSGNRTVFSNGGSGSEYLPISVSQTGGAGNTTRMFYDVISGKRRLRKVIAATAPEISCTDENATGKQGCRVLEFGYENAKKWGAPESLGDRLAKITYFAAGFEPSNSEVAKFSYDTNGRLSAAWDPRISPELKETYSYTAGGQLATLKPPGVEPWSFQYESPPGEPSIFRLASVQRASLVASNPTAQTTVVYGVPVSGSGAPYNMSPQEVAKWGQEDLPTDAAAIFPPDEVPANPPSSYAHAAVIYMDAEGQESNLATPGGAGTSAPSITTTETDLFGNINRELSAENRLRSLAAGSGSVAKSRELDSQYHYSADGTLLLDERGPVHAVLLESGPEAGTTKQARSYVSTQYDVGAPEPKAGETWPELPTFETSGALVAGKVLDQRTVQYGYNWTLRQQTETIVDPGGLNIRTITAYDKDTGLVTETRQPKDAVTAGAGTTKYIYYKKSKPPGSGECESDKYAGLLCKAELAAQPGTSGQPELPIRKILSYNHLAEPLEITEAPPGGESRKTVFSYDPAGRQLTKEVSGGGAPIPKVQTEYGLGTGLPTARRIVCPASEPTCDRQSNMVSYDALGRVKTYKDADEVTSEFTYDLLGRTSTVSDGKGTQAYRYDPATGLMVELEDSAAGVFTAAYDADRQMIQQGFPDGLTKTTTFDASGEASAMSYTKASNCGTSCTWLAFSVGRSARGQILWEAGTLGKDDFKYDGAGRLTQAREELTGGPCTTRNYKFDEDSNRTEMTTIPGAVGVCSSSGGSSQKFSYDNADRLLAEGLTYDDFGRIKNLPASLAGGKALATTYFSNDMIATQSQNGVTNSYQLDALLRPRQRLQAGGLQGTEIFHYAGPGDSPSWTVRGSTWTRNIVGIGGELVATQESGKEIELQLTNLHGDVAATAALSPTATSLTSTRSFDEFGNQTGGPSGARYGWLGGLERRTELPSGVIQMGARSYVPTIGRFLSSDPVTGGSANAYDYGNADPVNQFDPTGLSPYGYDSDCDRGYAPGTCQVKLQLWMWSRNGGRMGVRMRWRTNRLLGISLVRFDITYWRDERMDVYKEGFVKMDPPHYLNSYPGLPADCRATDPCADNHDGRGTFACNKGDQYQIQIVLKYRYNEGSEVDKVQILEAKTHMGCAFR
jgi:RHS repeat-associated protein